MLKLQQFLHYFSFKDSVHVMMTTAATEESSDFLLAAFARAEKFIMESVPNISKEANFAFATMREMSVKKNTSSFWHAFHEIFSKLLT